MFFKLASKVSHKFEVIAFPRPTQNKLRGRYWYEDVNNNSTIQQHAMTNEKKYINWQLI